MQIKLGDVVISNNCGNQAGFGDCNSIFERCVEPTDAHSNAITGAVAASPSCEVAFKVAALYAVDNCSPVAEVKMTLFLHDGTELEQTGSTSARAAYSP